MEIANSTNIPQLVRAWKMNKQNEHQNESPSEWTMQIINAPLFCRSFLMSSIKWRCPSIINKSRISKTTPALDHRTSLNSKTNWHLISLLSIFALELRFSIGSRLHSDWTNSDRPLNRSTIQPLLPITVATKIILSPLCFILFP